MPQQTPTELNSQAEEIRDETIENANTKERIYAMIKNMLDSYNHNATGSPALTAHENDVANPHAVTKDQLGLSEVDNTSDVNKPVSTAAQAAMDAHTTNVANPHAVTKAQVGLTNAEDTSDADKPISDAAQLEFDLRELLSAKGAALGYCELDNSGLVPASRIPIAGLQFQGVWDADTNSPILASSVGTEEHYYIVQVPGETNLNGTTGWKIGDWALFSNGIWNKIDNGNTVASVFGRQGAVEAQAGDYDASQITETATKKILTDVERTAISNAATHQSNTSNPHAVTKGQVGLGNVDNTSDINKPISTATQLEIDAHTNNTNNPHSVNKADLGLQSVDNTSDINKPISLATQAALDGKLDPNSILDGITATEAEILLKDPSTHIGQEWWARDTYSLYTAVLLISNVAGWQRIKLEYDGPTDTYKLPVTKDGQTHNLGQEIFFIGRNSNAQPATALDPKVYLAVQASVSNEDFQDCLMVTGLDLQNGSVFGINTTEFGIGAFGKITTYGRVNGVNTSAWSAGDILYVCTDEPGCLHNTKPLSSAFIVGKVLKSHATSGIIFVGAIGSTRQDAAAIQVGFDKTYFTADEETTTEGTFYLVKTEDLGNTPTATEQIIANDNQIVGGTKDHLSIVYPIAIPITTGIRDGLVEFQHNLNGAQEKVHLELYHADANGAVIDSGITANALGDLGVTPILTFSTAILDNDANDIFKEELRGLLVEDFTLPVGDRFRFHFLAEKVGTANGAKTFTFYFGSDQDTYVNSVSAISISDVMGLQQELDSLQLQVDNSLKPGGAWVPGLSLKNYLYRDGLWDGYPLVDTEDRLAPLEIGGVLTTLPDPFAMATQVFVGVVHAGSKITFTKNVKVKQIKIQATNLNSNTSYRVRIVDITDPANPITSDFVEPILVNNEWIAIAYGDRIIPAGSVFLIYLDILNNGTSSEITGGWQVGSIAGTIGLPGAGELTLNSGRTTIRYDKTDLDNVGRGTELAGVVQGSSIVVTETTDSNRTEEYVTTGPPVDGGTYFEYPISEVNTNREVRVGRVTSNRISIPIDLNTVYSEVEDYWDITLNPGNALTFATVEGYLRQNGVEPAGTPRLNAYPVDIVAQEISASSDWFIQGVSSL